MTNLDIDFFARDTITVAQDLIGTTIIVGKCHGRIVETEAYTTDAASHAAKLTRRSALMYETFGHIYVYLSYGMYYCSNFTCERDGIGAVLIRAVEPIRGLEEMRQRRRTDEINKLTSGPGRFSQAFGLDLRFNGKPIGRQLKLRERLYSPQISASPRIGITKATELEWRFFETDNPFVSRAKLIKSGQL
jgi:DNA-3-methyladenine glycosylase